MRKRSVSVARWGQWVGGVTVLGTLLACGGGGGGAEPPTTSSRSIRGVAAVGLPLVGTVTVRDANGLTRTDTVELADNGSFSVDVTGLTAPFVFRASGVVGGREYVVHSAATEADAGGTINITPLTDLIVSNVAGQLASNYFDSGDFSGLTLAELNAERDQLQRRLLPVLNELGVGASDLLRTPFTPLRDALDKALDILRVDCAAGVATITNVVTQQQIQDALATKAAQEQAADAMTDASGVSDAADDISAVRTALTNFANRFAAGLPSAGALQPLLSANFLYRDQTAAQFLDELTSAGYAVGVRFEDVVIERIDYSQAVPVAHVFFLIKTAPGGYLSQEQNWQMVKQNGQWLLHGDQRTLDVEVKAMMARTIQSGRDGACLESGLSLRVEDYDTTNNGGVVSHVIVTGPGLPEAGARLDAPGLGGYFPITSDTSNGGVGNYYTTVSSCSDFELTGLASLPRNTSTAYRYTFSVRSTGNTELVAYQYDVPARPLTLGELQASTKFPVVTSPSLSAWSTFTGGSLSVTATGFEPASLSDIVAIVQSAGEPGWQEVTKDVVVPANGMVATSIVLTQPTSPFTYRELQAENFTPDGREFVTRLVH
jgi:hypothetical protein